MSRLFNGSSDFIAMDSSHIYKTNVAFTISAWVKSSAGDQKVIYGEGLSSSTNGYFAFMARGTPPNTRLRALVVGSGGTTRLDLQSTSFPFDSAWHHFLYTQDASFHGSLYVDGGTPDTATVTNDSAVNPNRTGIGCARRNVNSLFFPGTICEVATWTRQLSTKEIVSLASGLPASFFGPTHYWPLWGVDSPEPDIGNSSHVLGTLTGTTQDRGGKTIPNLLGLKN